MYWPWTSPTICTGASSSSAHGWFIRIPRTVSSTTSISFSVSLPSAFASILPREFSPTLSSLVTTVSTISSDLESPITKREVAQFFCPDRQPLGTCAGRHAARCAGLTASARGKK